MKKAIFTLIFSLSYVFCYAQQPPIMVCNAAGTSCTPYFNLDTAITIAAAGSYIYVPGWSYPINVHINKELHLIGTGHYFDSTTATGRNAITGNLFLENGCDNSSIEGLYLLNDIVNNASANINNIRILRCKFSNMNYSDSGGFFNNCLINSCVIIGSLRSNSNNTIISNNIIQGIIYKVTNSTISNCILFSEVDKNGNDVSYSIIKNNIFDSGDYYSTYSTCGGGTTLFGGGCPSCMLSNNLTVYDSIGLFSITYYYGSCWGSYYPVVWTAPSSEIGTIVDVPTSNLFVNAFATGFSYSFDYHLLSTSPGHNAGDDGTDVGIYGGTGYKAGAVPSNPHFFYKNISSTTDTTGNLPVHFKVSREY